MKISIGINGFKDYSELEKREKLCIESLLRIKAKNINVNLYNVCFDNEDIQYDEFITLNKIKKTSDNIIREYFKFDGLQAEYELRKTEIDNNNRKLPSVKEIFDILADTDCDYFLFLNNDIILSNRFLKELEDGIECYPMSRAHIYDIDNLDCVPVLESYSVHGFDAFLVKKTTWIEKRNNFEDFILGKFYWDTYFFTIFNLFCKCKNLNKLPPVCYHIEHGSTSSQDSIENYYCEDVFKRRILVSRVWFSYVQNVLLKRTEVNGCKWYLPFPEEKQLELQYFTPFPFSSADINNNFKKEINLTTDTYDFFIPVHEKDAHKLPFLLESIYNNFTFNKIVITSPSKVNGPIDSRITYVQDSDILGDLKKENFTFRPGWTYQQLLKLFQSITESEYYVAVDSDAYFLKSVEFFNEKKPIWYYGWPQNHIAYNLFLSKLFKIDKSLNHTGIGDLGTFNKGIMSSFLRYCNFNTVFEFYNFIHNKLHLLFHLSEFELYSNFVNTHYPDLYTFKQIKQHNTGRDLNTGQQWSKRDIEQTIQLAKKTDADILLMHTWN